MRKNPKCKTYTKSFCEGKICVGCGYYKPKKKTNSVKKLAEPPEWFSPDDTQEV